MHQTAWLVDVGYVVKTAGQGLFKLDYAAGQQLLAARFGPTSTFLFNGYDAASGVTDGLRRFYDAMRGLHGMTVCLHAMGGDPLTGTLHQRRVDVDLAAHLVWQASLSEVGAIVLTTGDQDLIPAVDLARRRLNKPVWLFTFDRNVHRELIDAAAGRILFEEFRGQLEKK
jgi:uncharacterized LabA/DUF88 family protein